MQYHMGNILSFGDLFGLGNRECKVSQRGGHCIMFVRQIGFIDLRSYTGHCEFRNARASFSFTQSCHRVVTRSLVDE